MCIRDRVQSPNGFISKYYKRTEYYDES